jgi:hypothetical protein
MKKVSIILVFAAAIFSAGSCTKEGPAGPAGAAGKDGTANIITYNTTAAWLYSSSTATYYYDYSCSDLTQTNIDNGAVFAYASFTANAWSPLPTEIGNARYSFTYTTGMIQFLVSSTNGSGVNPFSNLPVKLVIIPPTQVKEHADVNYENYDEVRDAFNLE